jgi:hypothetical protein
MSLRSNYSWIGGIKWLGSLLSILKPLYKPKKPCEKHSADSMECSELMDYSSTLWKLYSFMSKSTYDFFTA